MRCKAVQKQLVAYIDGELDGQTRGIVKTHLGLCSACSVEYDRMRKALGAARGWKSRPLPEGFTEAVQERAGRGEQPRPIRLPVLDVRVVVDAISPRAWQVAAACAILVVGLVLGRLVWPRHVVHEAGNGAPHNGVRASAVETLTTLQKLKVILGMREGNERTIAELSAMQRGLADAIDPQLGGRVALYQEAEALIACGRLDEAEAILGDLESADPPFVLKPYVRITRLAAQPLPPVRWREQPLYAELLSPEVLASPERLYDMVAERSRRLAQVYTDVLDKAFRPFENLTLPTHPQTDGRAADE